MSTMAIGGTKSAATKTVREDGPPGSAPGAAGAAAWWGTMLRR